MRSRQAIVMMKSGKRKRKPLGRHLTEYVIELSFLTILIELYAMDATQSIIGIDKYGTLKKVENSIANSVDPR
jgi:hypothetical protein